MAVKRSTVVISGICVAIVGMLLYALPHSIRYDKLNQQCRFRLKRVATAMNLWSLDRGGSRLPPIRNDSPRTLWQVDQRPDSAAVLLREYLSGDDQHFRPQRSEEQSLPRRVAGDESEEAYRERLRERELTVCPASGFSYWFLVGEFGHQVPRRWGLMEPVPPGETLPGDSVNYARCQDLPDGSAPHQLDDGPGYYLAQAFPVIRNVDQRQVDELIRQVQSIEDRNVGKTQDQWTHDLLFLRQQVERFQAALAANPGGFPATRLDSRVIAVPRQNAD